MSLADLLGRASPNYNLYSGDRKILEDYRGAYDTYQSEYDAYKSAYDKFAAEAKAYQDRANAYNAAVAAWNEGPRTTPFEESSGYVAHPGEFTLTQPTAPADPGFTGEDVEAFMEKARGRAQRRGNAMATAQGLMGQPSGGVGGTQPVITIAGGAGPSLSGFSITPFAEGGAVPYEMGIGGLFQRYAEGGAVGGPASEMTQAELLNSGTLPPHDVLMNFAVNPDVYYDDARKELDRGNYGSAAKNYIIGLYGEFPGSSQLAAAVASAMERADRDRGDKTTAGLLLDTLKNLMVNDEGVPHMFAEPAVRNYQDGGAVGDPIIDLRQRVIGTYGFDPVSVAMEEGVDPELLLRMMYQESRGRADAVSPKGAYGLMQLMPDTANMLGVDPTDPLQNVRGGARYLRMMLDEFGTVPLALAAYNAGPGRVREYQGIPPFEETRNYVATITGASPEQILPAMSNFFEMPGVDVPVGRPRMRPEGLGTVDFVPTEPLMSEYLMEGYIPRPADRRQVSIPNLSMPQTPLEQAAMQQAIEAREQPAEPAMPPFTMSDYSMPR